MLLPIGQKIDFGKLNDTQQVARDFLEHCFGDSFESVSSLFKGYLEKNSDLDPVLNATAIDTLSGNCAFTEISAFDFLEISFDAFDDSGDNLKEKLEWAGIFHCLYNDIFTSDEIKQIPSQKREEVLRKWVSIHNFLEPRDESI